MLYVQLQRNCPALLEPCRSPPLPTLRDRSNASELNRSSTGGGSSSTAHINGSSNGNNNGTCSGCSELHYAAEAATMACLPLGISSLPAIYLLAPISSSLHHTLADAVTTFRSIVALFACPLSLSLPVSAPHVSSSLPLSVLPAGSPLPRNATVLWPYLIFLSTAILCLSASAIHHWFLCHCSATKHATLCLDYAGIASAQFGMVLTHNYYAFHCQPQLQLFYVTLSSVIGVAAFSLTLVPWCKSNTLRVLLFASIGLTGIVAATHRSILYPNVKLLTTITHMERRSIFFGALGAVFYLSRAPERWLPGRFDLLGSSHQWMHLCAVAAYYSHHLTCLQYLQWQETCAVL